MIDDTTSSRVLLSSRVRGLLERADDVVDVGLPTEDEAVSMLLSTAGMKLDTTPPEALAIVKFCNLLPLAIGIAVRLTASISLCAAVPFAWLMLTLFAGQVHLWIWTGAGRQLGGRSD